MRILTFLIDTLFFLLIAATLLRAWLNAARINMTEQPGPFVMALTNWLVMPLRRSLPSTLQRARWDVASLVAALLLAVTEAVIWVTLPTLFGSPLHLSASAWTQVPLLALRFLLRDALQGLLYLVLIHAVLSWVQPYARAQFVLGRLLEPLLAPIRRAVPRIGGVDLSSLVLLLALQVAIMLVD